MQENKSDAYIFINVYSDMFPHQVKEFYFEVNKDIGDKSLDAMNQETIEQMESNELFENSDIFYSISSILKNTDEYDLTNRFTLLFRYFDMHSEKCMYYKLVDFVKNSDNFIIVSTKS